MRKEILFNKDWLFIDEKVPLNTADEQFQSVDLPHSNKLFNHHNIDNQAYQFISTYRKNFEFQKPTDGSHIILQFDGVMLACDVYFNGRRLGEHKGGFINFQFDLTDFLMDGRNTLDVYVDSNERKDIPPFGHLVDYLTFGGIYRDVWLKVLPAQHIKHVFVQPRQVLTEPSLECKIDLHNIKGGMQLKSNLFDDQGNLVAEQTVPVEATQQTVTIDSLQSINLWDIENPSLYTLKTDLLVAGQTVDHVSTRFGFREAEFRKDGGFYLNGEWLKLVGLNRHQTYPYIGAAAPARLQRQDAEILKNELGCNVVRTSHYPQSPHFLNRCDEIGLLVFEEIAGWQHIGNEDWKQLVIDELQAMMERDYNHPSIILWGVRVNESPDDDDFYTHTNALAHQLDPVRQTGGVRCFLSSNFLEDVFTYNDFSNTVVNPPHTPYLITEYAGHMFPTKIWDVEDRLIEHALLHAKIQNLQRGHKEISGAIGWCAFDYATHIEFGSGDRICYHGVMDIFRLPKWAGYFYQSQMAPEKKVVLQAATHWTMGDRSGGGNNPLTVFSNCDEVEVIIGDINVGKFKPDHENYPHLNHPPFVIFGLNEFSAWGQRRFYDLHLVGYLNGEAVVEQKIASNKLPKKLVLKTSTPELQADGSDMAQISFFITDEFNNPLPYARNIIQFDLDGEGQLIGENPFPMMGGQGAVYVKAGKVPGTVTITARTPGLGEQKISLEVIRTSS